MDSNCSYGLEMPKLGQDLFWPLWHLLERFWLPRKYFLEVIDNAKIILCIDRKLRNAKVNPLRLHIGSPSLRTQQYWGKQDWPHFNGSVQDCRDCSSSLAFSHRYLGNDSTLCYICTYDCCLPCPPQRACTITGWGTALIMEYVNQKFPTETSDEASIDID